MKISIDTKEDSPDEIRKLIRMLSALVGDPYTEKAPPASGEGLFDMFGDPQASTSEQQQLGTGSNSAGATGINDFLDKQDGEPKPGSGDDDIKVVPY